jgi:DNA processing protein
MSSLDFASHNSFERAVSPFREMAAYEALWTEQGATFKTIADKFRHAEGCILPSELVPESTIEHFKSKLISIFDKFNVEDIGVRVHGAGNILRSFVMHVILLKFSTIRGGGI